MTDISIMMVTYNRLDLTKQTIADLSRTVHDDYNLIVVDNGSTDGTKDYLTDLKPTKLVLNKENNGIGRGRNQTLVEANKLGTKWFCTLDNDVLMPDGWLEECIDILKANPHYAAIGVNMEGHEYPIVNKNGMVFQDKPAGNLGTACMVFPLTTHKAVGFFKEYNKYGLEDSDFGMRLRFLGFKLGYISRSGKHLGADEDDKSEYRQWKTKEHDSRVAEFKRNCSLYAQGKLPIYIKCPIET